MQKDREGEKTETKDFLFGYESVIFVQAGHRMNLHSTDRGVIDNKRRV
jgi:hypothetical protein